MVEIVEIYSIDNIHLCVQNIHEDIIVWLQPLGQQVLSN